jgi:8-oxo-dGTP diphosphatase
MANENTNKTHATYNVGLKILLKKGHQYLFLTDAFGKHLDLPGGRIDENEQTTPLVEVIKREVSEEIGNKIAYMLGKPIFQFRRHFESKNLRIFHTIYEAEYLSGEIQLSDEHCHFQWLDQKQILLKEKEFFHQEEFLAIKKHFENL